jgi:hypothetical protein
MTGLRSVAQDNAAVGQAASVPCSSPPGTAVAAAVEQRWRRVIAREHQGQERTHLAGLLGVPLETFRGVLSPSPEKQRRPRLGDAAAALALCEHPCSAFDAVLEPVGLRVVPIAPENGDPYETIAATLAAVTALTAVTSPHGPGGARITPAEAAGLRPMLDAAEDALRRLRVQLAKEHGA